jgi:hypothetical protein
MNTLLSANILNTKKELKQKIENIPNPHHEKKVDAMIKWVGILEAFETIENKYDVIVNIGCGLDSLPLYLKPFCEQCYALDMGLINPEYSKNDIIVRQTNFFDWNELPAESVDIFIDSCAVTHFDIKSANGFKNVGIKNTFEKVSHLLKKGGYFIITSDCVSENTDSIEFVQPQYWIDIAKSMNLVLTSEFVHPTLHSNHANTPFSFVYNRYNLKILRLMFQKM